MWHANLGMPIEQLIKIYNQQYYSFYIYTAVVFALIWMVNLMIFIFNKKNDTITGATVFIMLFLPLVGAGTVDAIVKYILWLRIPDVMAKLFALGVIQ